MSVLPPSRRLQDTLAVVFKHHTESVRNNRVAKTLIEFLYERLHQLEEKLDLPSAITSERFKPEVEQGLKISDLDRILTKHYDDIIKENLPLSDSHKKEMERIDSQNDILLNNDERTINKIKLKFKILNDLQESGITDFLNYKETVMHIMKDLVINHNDPQKYFTTE